MERIGPSSTTLPSPISAKTERFLVCFSPFLLQVMRFMDDKSITDTKEFSVGNYLVQMVSDFQKRNRLDSGRFIPRSSKYSYSALETSTMKYAVQYELMPSINVKFFLFLKLCTSEPGNSNCQGKLKLL